MRPSQGVTVVSCNSPRRYAISLFYSYRDATTSIDLIMLTMFGGGRVRTAREFRTLLEGGGFTLSRILPTESSVSVIEALPA